MRTIIFILTLFLATSISFGQEHLEPVPEFLTNPASYPGKLLPKLTKGFHKKALAQYIVLPSFSAEYALSLEKSHRKKYKLKLNRCSGNYWYAKEKKNVKIVKSSIFIPENFAIAIANLFELGINQIKKPNPKNVELLPLDGTNYYFSLTNKNDSVLTGKIWSPYPNSLMRELVSICDNLVTLTSEENSKTENILSKIKALTLKLNETEHGKTTTKKPNK